MMNRLSACLVTLNEEHNLPRVLGSLEGIADELIVVDCGSQDRTIEIAREHGAKIVNHPWTNFAEQKNLAAAAASHDWILSLDADEELSPELRGALLGWKKEEPRYAVYEFARRTWYLGAWMWHTRWYPDYQKKLYRRDKTKLEVPFHAAPKYEGPVGRLKGDLLHYTVSSAEEHAEKVESYTTRIAQDMFAEGRRNWRAAMWFAPPWNWFNNYVLCLGFLDGYRGWVIALMAARGTWLKFKKLGKLIEEERRVAEMKAP
jgi:glycosyltransferase involved in cell wall biosynthesis